MADAMADSSVTRRLMQLQAAITKQAQEKQFWFDNLLDYADWLRQHVHAIETFIGNTLLQIEAEALATAMRKADERQHQYKTAIGNTLAELDRLKQAAGQTHKPTSTSTSESTDAEQPQTQTTAQTVGSETESVIDDASDDINDMYKWQKRRQAKRAAKRAKQAKQVLESDFEALKQSKFTKHNRCKGFIKQADRQLRAASNEGRKNRVETWKTRRMLQSLVEVESKTMKLDDKVSTKHFFEAFEFERTDLNFKNRNKAETNSATKDEEYVSCVWHRPTGHLCTSESRAYLEKVLTSYLVTNADKSPFDFSDVENVREHVNVKTQCLVENLGIVCFCTIENPLHLMPHFLLVVFDKITGEIITLPKHLPEEEHSFDYRIVNTGSGRFVVFGEQSGVYREFAVHKSCDAKSSSKNTLRKLRLRNRFVLTNTNKNLSRNFFVNGRVRHAIVVYKYHAVIVSTEPRARLRAFINIMHNEFDETFKHENCLISDSRFCLILRCIINHMTAHFYDLNGVALHTVSLSPAYLCFRLDYFSCIASFVSSSKNNSENSQLTLILHKKERDEVHYVRFQSLVKHSLMGDSRERSSTQTIENLPDVNCWNICKPTSKTFPISGEKKKYVGIYLFCFAQESECFYRVNYYKNKSRPCIYRAHRHVKTDLNWLSHFEKWVTLPLQETQRITGLCPLGADWVVAVVNNALLVTIDARSGERVNTVRFCLDECHKDALISSADSTHLFVSHIGGNVVKLECEERLFNWRVVNHRSFNVWDMFYDKYSSLLALGCLHPPSTKMRVRICTKSLQILKDVNLSLFIYSKFPIYFFYKSMLVYGEKQNDPVVCFFDLKKLNEFNHFADRELSYPYFNWVERVEKDHGNVEISLNFINKSGVDGEVALRTIKFNVD